MHEPEEEVDFSRTAVSAEMARLVAASALAVLILAGGVYWLHHLPARTGTPENSGYLQVRLVLSDDQPTFPTTSGERRTNPARGAPGITTEPEPLSEDVPLPEPTSPSDRTATVANADASSSRRKAASDKAVAKFRQQLLRHIARFQRYPSSTHGRAERNVQVLFRMRRDGSLLDAWVSSSSGDVILDGEAIATLHRAEPLPSIPGELPGELRILLPIAFSP